MKKKIYVAGAGGMLGEAIFKIFKGDYDLECSDIDVNETWIKYLDFREYEPYKKAVTDYSPQYLFHIGAHTDLEYCELNVEDTYLTNTISVEHAINISNALEIPLIYISTAGIFDGSKDIFDDWDRPNPIAHYARSKYAGEQAVQMHSKEYLICRAGWMMGGGPQKDKKFIQKLMLQLKNGAKVLNVVDDKLGTPTYTHDFARNLKVLLEKGHSGLYNMVCGGVTGRYEVARELIELLGLAKEVELKSVKSDFWKDQYFADRPPSERLINRRLDLKNMNGMRDWRLCLKEYLDNYYSGYLNS